MVFNGSLCMVGVSNYKLLACDSSGLRFYYLWFVEFRMGFALGMVKFI